VVSAEVINTIRLEIVANHILMHLTTLVVLAVVIIGVTYADRHRTVLSVFIPVVTLSWAAAVARFDYLIHRQGAFVAALEQSAGVFGWETWKATLKAKAFVMPIFDVLSTCAIVIPTIYLLFGPATMTFRERQWRGVRLYRWGILGLLTVLLIGLAIGPWLARQ
jgi:hypothetical protein